MAEVFGVAATTVQLADIGVRTALSISRLVSELRHAHETVQGLSDDKERLTSLIKQMQTTYLASHMSMTPALERCIQDCIRSNEEVESILDPLIREISDRRFARARKAALTVRTKECVKIAINRVADARSNLTLCLDYESNRNTDEALREIRSLSSLSRNLPGIAQRVQSIDESNVSNANSVQSMRDSLAVLQ